MIEKFALKQAGGDMSSFSQYLGKVVLVVNTASQCGFTPQYMGLEELYKKYGNQEFEILAFPCNQFGGQEPGDAEEIKRFCTLNYDVSFPLMDKIDVNGKDADPFWEHLKSKQAGLLGSRKIKWNFTKFLIDKKGNVVGRFGPQIKPESLGKDIEKLLAG